MSVPMTERVYLEKPYARTLGDIRVVAHGIGGQLLVERTIFYPAGGGQPGDCGQLCWEGQRLKIVDTVKAEGGGVALIAAESAPLPAVGARVEQRLDWQRRYRHMRMHTALHLLSVVIPLPVTGGAMTAEKGRLDFNMPEALADKAALEQQLNALVMRDLAVRSQWISDAQLQARPELVKTMSVKPPRGAGPVRLVQIGEGAEQVDLQPCGGTHVARTGEIGPLRLGKVEKKGRQNRRVHIFLVDA